MVTFGKIGNGGDECRALNKKEQYLHQFGVKF